MADFPKHAATVNLGVCSIGTADTSRTAPASTSVAFTAGANGSIVARIRIVAVAAIAVAGMVRFFLKRSGTYYLLWERPVPVDTVGANDPAFYDEFAVDDCNLKNGDTIEAATEKADTFKVFVFGADY